MTASPGRPVGVIVGLRAEARLVAAAAPRRGFANVHCASGDAARSVALVEAEAPALVSFGIAGGLDPALAPGALVLAHSVVMPGGDVVPTDHEWRERVRRTLAPAVTPVVAPVAGSLELVADPAAKAALWAQTSAAAVDMESHATAQAARRAGLPLLVLRAIADPANGRLPAVIRRGFAEDGRARPLAVLGSTLLAPSQIPNLICLARHAYSGMRSLRRAVEVLGPRFRFDETPVG